MPKSRAKRGCASKLACGRRIDPAEQSVFSVNPGEFVIFFWADRVVGPYRLPHEFAATLQLISHTPYA